MTLALVTGANGHLGNNMVRALLANGIPVRGSVRNPQNRTPFADIDLDLVYADLMDKDSLRNAMQGVDTLYQVAANFSNWSRNPQRDIIENNMQGTRNVLEAAAESGVRRVVYVSSVGALDQEAIVRGDTQIDETGWNHNSFGDHYFQSKADSERLALELADQLDLDLVTVLPGAIIGPHAYRLTPSMSFLYGLLSGQLSIDVNFYFNFVDVRDVAGGMLAAAERGTRGERYILATEEPLGQMDVLQIARELVPNLPTPRRIPRPMVMAAATMMELGAQVTGKAPPMVRSQVRLFYGAAAQISIAKARAELGFDPRSPQQALREALAYVQAAHVAPAKAG